MRYLASEKLEIIRTVEGSHLPVKQTLDMLGIPRTTFYRWYDLYVDGGYCGQRLQISGAGRRGPPYRRAPRLGPRPFTISDVNSFRGSFVWTASLITYQYQAKPCHCSCRVAPIIERIDLGYPANPTRVLICLTAP